MQPGDRSMSRLLASVVILALFATPSPGADLARPFPVPETTPKRTDVAPFEYNDVGPKIPNYLANQPKWGREGDLIRLMQEPIPAEESAKHLVVPEGFHVELFADESILGGGKPLCMTWDDRGRLWVSLTYDYPHDLQPPGEGRDRIKVLEDTDGDHRADKAVDFADRLSIPTSIAFREGGAIVHNGTETLYLKDNDGDGRADERRVLFGEWSQRDTHGGPSNMQYGLDNWIWGMQGYNDSRLMVGGEEHRFRQGFLRFKPDGSDLEFIRSTNNNTWGLGISEEGIIFGSTANRNPSVFMPIPNRYYEAVRGWTPSLVLSSMADTHLFHAITDKVRQVDHHGGYTAGAGHALYTARAYPQEYWNRTAFVCEPTGHLVGTFVLIPDGSDFHSTNPFNILASDDEWTAPIMAEVGPDGNVWVIDWYNFIVQHNPTPVGFETGRGAAYLTDLRDKTYGRIYRVVAPGPVGKARTTLAGASPQDLIEALRDPNLFWRRHAQRLLVERANADVAPALQELIADTTKDPIGLNVGAIHALWTLHGLGSLDGSDRVSTASAVEALRHPSVGVRRNAVQVLPRSNDSVAAILASGVLADPDAQVRLWTILSLADQPPTPDAARALAKALREPKNAEDRWIPEAIACAGANNAEAFLLALGGPDEPSGRALEVTAIVAEHFARGGPVGSMGEVLAHLVEADPATAEAAVRGFSRGWPASAKLKDVDRVVPSLEALADRLGPEGVGRLFRLAEAIGTKALDGRLAEITRTLIGRASDESADAPARISAARALVSLKPDDLAIGETLLDQIRPRTPPDVAEGLLESLRASEASGLGASILDRLRGFTPSARSKALGVLLVRPPWTATLLDRIDQGGVLLTDLAPDVKQALAQYPSSGLRRRTEALLQRDGAMPSPDRQKVLEAMLPVAKQAGDTVAGEVVFKNQCAKCHVRDGQGSRIGPDLTGMSTHPKEELLTHILDPNRSVEGNFRLYTVATANGQVLSGLLASESRTAVELIDAEGRTQSILRDDIEELSASNRSLMPEGFEQQLKPKEMADLLQFLTKPGAVDRPEPASK